MSVVTETLNGVSLIEKERSEGPITRSRLRRSRFLHGALCVLGTVPWLLEAPASWEAFGWGLWLPGAGFIAVGGWAWLLFPATLLFFGLAFVAWFGAGMIVAPILVWGASAVTAGAMAGSAAFSGAPIVVPSLTIAFLVGSALRRRRRFDAELELRDRRNAYLPKAVAEVRELRSRAPELEERELDSEQLGMLRYVLDRALQPIGELGGFDRIDQFQTSALRYQLNQVGWALSIAQRHYAPSFHGYLSEGQRRAIEQYLERQIWGYWRWENAWGNFDLDFDPAKKDNVMLTGYFNINVLLYMNNTGDRRYAEPGSLTFRYDDRRTFSHDVHSINRSLLENFHGQTYCLYPCEPNWIYSACNFRGLTALTLYDTVFGTNHVEQLRPVFRERLEDEFINADSAMVALRSKHTGHALPFPAPDAVLVKMLSPLFPDLAERYWAIARYEQVERTNGRAEIRLEGRGVDFGNYKAGHIFNLDGMLGGANEIGDVEVATAAKRALDEVVGRVERDGVVHYQASNMGNLMAIESHFGFRNAWRDAICSAPPPAALEGPILSDAPYPDVLVARAVSNGDDLDLVLHPGRASRRHTLGLSRLKPGRRYRVTGGSELLADDAGEASVTVELTGRTSLRIEPIAST